MDKITLLHYHKVMMKKIKNWKYYILKKVIIPLVLKKLFNLIQKAKRN